MPAIYANFLNGAVNNNPLSSGGTTLTSSELTTMPVVTAPDFMWVALDPFGEDGAPEIVRVTAHSASSGSATIQRGQQNTTARQHSQGTKWMSGWTRDDITAVYTAIERTGEPGDYCWSMRDTKVGWLKMGQAVPDAQSLYPDLWAVCPADWKVASTLNLPSMDGRVFMGVGVGQSPGDLGGSATITIEEENLPPHVHVVSAHIHTVSAHIHTIGNHTHTGPSHTHTGPAHTHTLVHTHPINHDHPSFTTSVGGHHRHHYTVRINPSASGSSGEPMISNNTGTDDLRQTRAEAEQGTHDHVIDVPSFTGTSGEASAATTSSSGTGATGAAGTGNTSSAGAGDTSSAGGGDTSSAGGGDTGPGLGTSTPIPNVPLHLLGNVFIKY